MASRDTIWIEHLYSEYYDRLCKLAWFKLKNYGASTDDARDIVQDVFLLALKTDIRGHANPPGWLFKTTHYYCMNYIHAHWREYKRRAEMEAAEIPVPPPEVSDDHVMETLKQHLSPQDFHLLKAYCLDQIPINELSAQTGLSENAIYVRIHRIRKHIRGLFLVLLIFFHQRRL